MSQENLHTCPLWKSLPKLRLPEMLPASKNGHPCNIFHTGSIMYTYTCPLQIKCIADTTCRIFWKAFYASSYYILSGLDGLRAHFAFPTLLHTFSSMVTLVTAILLAIIIACITCSGKSCERIKLHV